MKICSICEKGELVKKIVPYWVHNINLGEFPAEVCTKCGEQWFSEETAKKIEKIEAKV